MNAPATARRPIAGLHHVTAIAGPAQRNLDFWSGTLGLRLVKRTVNFDDPGTWHLYLGDAAGTPGTLVTFFPWAGVPAGRHGTGETSETAFAVPADALAWWRTRLERAGAVVEGVARRFGEPVLSFLDPDGLRVELVASGAPAPGTPWSSAEVPVERAIRGLHGVTLALGDVAPSAELLRDAMGLRELGSEDGRTRFAGAGGAAGSFVDLAAMPGVPRAALGAGSVHHVAFRVADDADQLAWRAALTAAGRRVTGVMDRNYFHSVYFREPGGVLFELATDPPGFTVDEPADALGASLRLPEWLEPQRAGIERALTPLRLPGAGSAP